MEGKNSEIIKRRSQLSPAKQAILEKRLRGESEYNQEIPIPRRTQQSPCPLSLPQQRLWFIQQLEPQNSAYNEFACLQLKGAVNFAILERSFNEIIKRHESLRTSFETLDGQPVQVIHPTVTLKLPVVDLRNLPPTLQDVEVELLTAEIAQKPFDLAFCPLLRVILLQVSEEEYLLLLVVHHIVCDGWSIKLFNQELAEIYKDFFTEKPSALAELPIQYADYSIWQHQWLQGEREKTQLSYWKQQLADAPTTLSLPTDRQRPPVQSFKGAVRHFKLSSRLTDMLRSLSKEQGVTLFMTLLAAFQAQLYRYTGQEDICIGSPIANRNHADIESLIGFFVNTLVLRTDLSGNPSFLELLKRVHEVCVGAYAHAGLPFERLVKELHPERNLSHNPLFQVMFVLQENNDKDLVLPNLTLKWLQNHSGRALFDLTLNVVDAKSELWGWWEYNTDLFDAATIERMVGHFTNLLEGVVSRPEKPLSDLPLLTEPERQTLLVNWNNTATDYPQDKCIHELFESQVEKTPDAVAVVFENQQLSYRELNRRANQLAHYLQKLGVKPEVLVGICVERSLEMVIGLLAILKACGAYVPLDPGYPQERLAYVLENSQPGVLLTQQYLLENIPNHQAQVICIDSDWEKIATESTENPISNITFDNLAYVIYTSGSTGKPKGVLGLHKGAINRFQWMWQNYPFVEEEICCQKTSLNFVDSVWEIFGSLLQGITIVIVPDKVVKDPQHFVRSLAHSNVTRLVLVPSLLCILLNTYDVLELQLPKLKLWISSGEALSNDLLVQFRQGLPNSTLLNLYGSSEVSADVTCYSITPQTVLSASTLIGRPIANTQIYILDANKQPVPIGVIGEIYIGGEQLARGYLNRPQLSAEKFIPNPFSEELAARLYKTGDLARYLPNGNIEYIGRIDNQVKVRGFRIELGEIEALLSQHPGVREAVVAVQSSQIDSQRIVAYVVPTRKQAPTISELRGFLEAKLPNYMVPAAFVTLEALPLTPNGKVDRKALPAPKLTQVLSSNITPPSTPIENLLAGIWAEILGIDKIGIHNNFFELGGHSLIATRVISQIRQVFQTELPLRYLFEKPTIAGLAKEIEKAIKVDSTVEVTNIEQIERTQQLSLSYAQQRLWFLSQLEPDSPFYNIPGAVRLQGQLNVEALQQSFNEIVSRHEALRTNFQTKEGQAVAVVSEDKPITLSILDISDLPANQQQAEIKQQVAQAAQQLFDISNDHLLRVKLLRLALQEHIVLLTMHHIISDAWSIGVLVEELAALYPAFCHGQPSPLPTLPIQYVDFAAWQRQWLQGEALEAQLSYWLKQLDNAPKVLELPTDYPRPAIQTYRGATYSFELPKELSTSLNQLSQQQGSTLFMTLLASFQILLWRYSGQQDIVVGSPIANRNRADIEALIGVFVNTLVLRSNLTGNPSFEELLKRVREVALGAYAHQDLPFELLVERLQPQRDLSHTPLFQVMFVLQNAPMSALDLPGLTLTKLESDSGTAQFDLTLEMTETAQGISGNLVYDTDLFAESSIHRIVGHLQTLLEAIVANPQQRLSDLPLLTEFEQHQLLREWNNTTTDYPQDKCIHELFEAQVEKTPDAVAVVFENQQLSYGELNQRANQLAHYLCSLGVKPEVLVGLCTQRSLEMIIGLLAILKAGGAYLPIDPTYPPERLALMLNDSQVTVLLAQQHLLGQLPAHTAKVICLDDDVNWQGVSSAIQNPPNQTAPANLAYMIYTSGSTGKPKGVMVEHRSLLNFVLTAIDEYGINASDRILQFASICFDTSIEEIFPCLVAGATLVLRTEEMLYSVDEFWRCCQQWQLTVLDLPTAYWHQLVAELNPQDSRIPQNLRTVIIGGEEAQHSKVEHWHSSVAHLPNPPQLFNSYGPWEFMITSLNLVVIHCF
ncbi:non-ribosomal peptide synthetase [Nostoc favosum]|uniref:non-ribosomal peptide synthetase n=1 Tax=Nostoc favosum TaxID=2907819 RepID=UPI002795E8AD|nr:non-ribosomal peptide synthetase [Nostoc favosum]